MFKLCMYLLKFACAVRGAGIGILETTSASLSINVTGHLSGKRLAQNTLFMQPLTWHEALQECGQNNLGMLGFWRPFTHMDSILDDLLLQAGPYTNATIWENAFRPSASNEWYSWRGAGSCTNRGDLPIYNPDDPGQCVALVFDVPSETPSFRKQNCSERHPSFCMLKIANDVTVEEYPGYDYTDLPSAVYLRQSTNVSWDECRTTCATKDTCIGCTYENSTRMCRWLYMLRFTGQFVNYTITWVNETLTHFVIVSPLGRVVPANSSYTPLPVGNTLPSCVTSAPATTSTTSPMTSSSTTPGSSTLPTSISTTSPTSSSSTTPGSSTIPTSISIASPTTSSSTTPGSSTIPTSISTTTSLPTSPSTHANPIYQTTSVPFCTKCCHLNGTNNNTVNMTTLSDTIDEIVRNLTVSKIKTSKYRRQLTSAEDDRPSSAAAGAVAVVIISSVLCLIIVSDVKYLIDHFNHR